MKSDDNQPLANIVWKQLLTHGAKSCSLACGDCDVRLRLAVAMVMAKVSQ